MAPDLAILNRALNIRLCCTRKEAQGLLEGQHS